MNKIYTLAGSLHPLAIIEKIKPSIFGLLIFSLFSLPMFGNTNPNPIHKAGDFLMADGSTLDFDGSNDYVSGPLPALFTNIAANDFSVEAWIYPQGTGTSRLFSAQQDGSNFTSVLFSGSNQVYFYVVTGGTFSIATSNTLPLNAWSHVACTWVASTMSLEIYINR